MLITRLVLFLLIGLLPSFAYATTLSLSPSPPASADIPEMVLVPQLVWKLKANDSLAHDLQSWCTQAGSGWTLVWRLPQDWSVPATTEFSGDFMTAVQQLVESLSATGVDVHASVYLVNHVLVIDGNGESRGQ